MYGDRLGRNVSEQKQNKRRHTYGNAYAVIAQKINEERSNDG
jgi:hypothetical protein